MQYCLINPAPAFPLIASHPHISSAPHAMSIFLTLLFPITPCFVTTLSGLDFAPDGVCNWPFSCAGSSLSKHLVL